MMKINPSKSDTNTVKWLPWFGACGHFYCCHSNSCTRYKHQEAVKTKYFHFIRGEMKTGGGLIVDASFLA